MLPGYPAPRQATAPAYPTAVAEIEGPRSVSTPRSSNRAGGFPAPGSRTRSIHSQESHTATDVGWPMVVWHRVRVVPPITREFLGLRQSPGVCLFCRWTLN
jgi:hypothetical protein